ncbi:hypothetical protein V1503_06145 [Bacillus sp. SCS-151]|uniref:hypothetical protein n=1 Tax=Nanhaiella sioensis TaxID=3115293 RepID=UPI003978D5A5
MNYDFTGDYKSKFTQYVNKMYEQVTADRSKLIEEIDELIERNMLQRQDKHLIAYS